jgi:hypothetical protein
MACSAPQKTQILPLPPRRIPAVHLPVLGSAPQTSTSTISDQLAMSLKHHEARQPVRARKTTPPVVAGYIPIDKRPLPPVTIHQPDPESVPSLASETYVSPLSQLDGEGLSTAFGAMEGAGAIAEDMMVGTLTAGGQGHSTGWYGTDWRQAGEQHYHAMSAPALYQLDHVHAYFYPSYQVDMNAQHVPLVEPPHSDPFFYPAYPPPTAAAARPRAFPLHPGSYSSSLLQPAGPISYCTEPRPTQLTTRDSDSHVNKRDPAQWLVTPPNYPPIDATLPVDLRPFPVHLRPFPIQSGPSSKSRKSTVEPSVSLVPTFDLAPSPSADMAPPAPSVDRAVQPHIAPSRRSRIPTPIIIPSQACPIRHAQDGHLPTPLTHTIDCSTHATSQSLNLLTPQTALHIDPQPTSARRYIPYREQFAPYPATPLETVYPFTPSYPILSSQVSPSSSDTYIAYEQPGIPFCPNLSYQFSANTFVHGQAVQPQPVMFATNAAGVSSSWSDAGVPDLISSSNTLSIPVPNSSPVTPFVDALQPTLDVSIHQDNSHITPPSATGLGVAISERSPLGPSDISPAADPASGSSLAPHSRFVRAKSDLKATMLGARGGLGVKIPSGRVPLTYSFPDKYAFADLVDADDTDRRKKQRTLSMTSSRSSLYPGSAMVGPPYPTHVYC